MTKKEFKDILDHYTEGVSTPEETALFDSFVDKMTEQPLNWKLEEKERIKIEIYKKIRQEIVVPKPTGKIIQMPIWLRIAASIALILTAGIYFISLKNSPVEYMTVSTDYGQRDTILLADGSRIFMNAASQVTYPKKFKQGSRDVTLQGEAFFEGRKQLVD